MIDGVTLVGTRVVSSSPLFFVLAAVVGVLGSVFISRFLYLGKSKDTLGRIHRATLMCFAILCYGLAIGSCVAAKYDPLAYVEYIVEVDESASFLEFTETYEVRSHTGHTYTVCLKEDLI